MDDLISRAAAIDTAEWAYKACEGNLSYYHDLLVAALTDLTPAQRWIPCSERLPKVREWVLCQCRAGIMDVLRLTDDNGWFKDCTHTYMHSFVLAWMPLPKPWEGEEYGTSRAVLSQKPMR